MEIYTEIRTQVAMFWDSTVDFCCETFRLFSVFTENLSFLQTMCYVVYTVSRRKRPFCT